MTDEKIREMNIDLMANMNLILLNARSKERMSKLCIFWYGMHFPNLLYIQLTAVSKPSIGPWLWKYRRGLFLSHVMNVCHSSVF